MAVTKTYLSLSLVSCLVILTCFKSSHSHGHYNKHVALFIFGDSLFDSGNNNYINTSALFLANFWPYGESYFNPPTGRFSDGRLIPDFIAEFAGLPLIPTYLDPNNNEFMYGANFASAGSFVVDGILESNTVLLKTQIQYFIDLVKDYRKNLGEVKAKQLLSDAVFLFSCGGNDYKILVEENRKNGLHYEEYVGMVIGNLTDVFKVIHENGGRKIGIGMLKSYGCLLANRANRTGNTCDEDLNIVSSLHDKALLKILQDLTQQLEGFMYAVYEPEVEINKRLKNPSKYGFKVGDSACCGIGRFRSSDSCGGKRGIREFELCDNPNEYVLFDIFHPTEANNRQLAELFWNGSSKVRSPYNLKDWFQSTICKPKCENFDSFIY